MNSPERLEMQSADGVQLNLDALYQIAPSCFTEAADPKMGGGVKRVVNFDVLRQLLGDDAVEDAPEAYEFNWVGKQAARAEVLRPINKTLRPVKKDSVDWDNTQNLYIEGDNLEVLKLLQKSYLGKVKMIYIDPPYNTGNDFIYHDDRSRSQEEEDLSAGNIDELGNRYRKNTDSNGRFHSEWCSMIYSRLMVARSLLTEDGAIFIHIDENEVNNLLKICNEVYGESNFVSLISVKTKVGGVSGSSEGKSLKGTTEYICLYTKDKFSFLMNPVYIKTKLFARIKNYEEQGKSWKYTSIISKLDDKELIKEDDSKGIRYYGYRTLETMSITSFAEERKISIEEVYNRYADKIFQTTNAQSSIRRTVMDETIGLNYPMVGCEYIPIKGKNEGNLIEILYKGEQRRMMMFLSDYVEKIKDEYYYLDRISNLWDDIDYNNLTKEGDIEFPNGKKPIKLIQRMLSLITTQNDIVMDFFSGSASTAHAVMQLNAEDGGNRKFIMVQLPEETPEDSEAYKAGYKNICEIGKERIRRAGKKIKEESPLTTQDLDTGFRVFRVDSSNYEEVEHSPKDWNQDQLELFLNNIKADRDDLDLLFGCMLGWGVQLSLPMTTEEVDGKKIYIVNEGDLVACFDDKVTDNVVKAMAEKQPLRVIFRDSCFERDADKINIYETFKQLLDWSDQEVVKNIRVI